MKLGRFALPAISVCASALAGCSDPTAPASKGAVTMFVREPNDGNVCGATHNTVIPNTATVGINNEPGPQRVVNGQDGASVSCQLRGDLFTARIEQRTASMGTQNVSITGTLAAGEAGSASMTNYTDLHRTLTSPPTLPCTLFPAEVNKDRVFARFECQRLSKPPSNNCVADGAFVFENCE